jgi:hypothetical protein
VLLSFAKILDDSGSHLAMMTIQGITSRDECSTDSCLHYEHCSFPKMTLATILSRAALFWVPPPLLVDGSIGRCIPSPANAPSAAIDMQPPAAPTTATVASTPKLMMPSEICRQPPSQPQHTTQLVTNPDLERRSKSNRRLATSSKWPQLTRLFAGSILVYFTGKSCHC